MTPELDKDTIQLFLGPLETKIDHLREAVQEVKGLLMICQGRCAETRVEVFGRIKELEEFKAHERGKDEAKSGHKTIKMSTLMLIFAGGQAVGTLLALALGKWL